MTPFPEPRSAASTDLNHLRQGTRYQATTHRGRVATGEYLGIEVAGETWRILLRSSAGTHSIAIRDLETVLAAA
jgi:hypothetical protein